LPPAFTILDQRRYQVGTNSFLQAEKRILKVNWHMFLPTALQCPVEENMSRIATLHCISEKTKLGETAAEPLPRAIAH